MTRRRIQRTLLRSLICARLALGPMAADVGLGSSTAPFQLQHWTTENGLPGNTLTSILQTRDGYLWIGTKAGLARFDGVRFRVFTDELSNGEGEDLECRNLAEDTNGRLWVRLLNALLCRDHGHFRRFPVG